MSCKKYKSDTGEGHWATKKDLQGCLFGKNELGCQQRWPGQATAQVKRLGKHQLLGQKSSSLWTKWSVTLVLQEYNASSWNSPNQILLNLLVCKFPMNFEAPKSKLSSFTRLSTAEPWFQQFYAINPAVKRCFIRYDNSNWRLDLRHLSHWYQGIIKALNTSHWGL